VLLVFFEKNEPKELKKEEDYPKRYGLGIMVRLRFGLRASSFNF
jgi:hypothetical protein